MKIIKIILLAIAVIILGVGGLVSTAVFGKAPKCPAQGNAARSDKEIGDAIEKKGATITDGEATTLTKKYVGNFIDDPRVCFTSGLGHLSGNIKLGPVNPSFYASTGVDLSGSYPKAVNLDIKVGALPDIPFISARAEQAVTILINQNLAKFKLAKKYSANFTSGSVTIQKLAK